MARWGSEEKGELRESVELLRSLSESSCANNGAISEPCVVCAPPKLTSDDGDGAGRVGSWSTQLIILFRIAESCSDGMMCCCQWASVHLHQRSRRVPRSER
jgi:hypothetical protein